ncbi:MAG: DUF2283 domain-containing protein [Chloroflexota bacterium]|nr:DUF2283 domain-containing protein [Chloroflexota bacterium]
MADRMIRVWYDKGGDFLEMMFERKEGFFRETLNDSVMEKVDSEGNAVGFSITNVSKASDTPLEVALP